MKFPKSWNPVWLALCLLVCLSTEAAAHDDPVVTVRVLCNGFNVLDSDAVLGEISDSATLSVDRPVHGIAQIEAWVKEEMDNDLRIEIVDIGAPRKLSDGYTLAWTARISRQDWRKAGIESRTLSSVVVIHNGRITDWTAKPATDAAVDEPAAPVTGTSVASDAERSGTPEIAGIPISLVLAGAIAISGAAIGLRLVIRG